MVDVQFGPEALLGPFALLVGALIAVGVLWREDRRVYKERVADLMAQRDSANAREAVALAGWQEQTSANTKLAAAWTERNRIEAGRRRRSDGA